MSALSLAMLIADGEGGADIFHIAANVEQASICFDESANMVRYSDALNSRLVIADYQKWIKYPATASRLKVLSGDKKGKHGFNSHCVIFDELAEQKQRDLWDILRYSFAARKQPLLISISTAGYDRESLGYEQYQYSKRVKSNEIEDLYFLPLIYETPEGADWTDSKVWASANPSWGITINETEFAEAATEAKAEPRKEANFRTLRLNDWSVGHADMWLSTQMWDDCYEDFTEDEFKGERCVVGIDLARKYDLGVALYLFDKDNCKYLVPRVFMPADNVQEAEERDGFEYGFHIKQGHIEATPGDVIDYQYIRRRINEDAKRFRIQEIGFDPYNAELFCNQQLGDEDGFNVVLVPQTIGKMGPATFEFERLVKAKRIKHNNNPVLNWCAQNAVVKNTDDQGRIMISKKLSTNKIDCIVAAIIALSRAMAGEVENIYNQRGIVTL